MELQKWSQDNRLSDQLLEYLKRDHEGLVETARTLDHRIEEIRTEFHLEMPYDRRTRTYSLSDEDLKSVNSLLNTNTLDFRPLPFSIIEIMFSLIKTFKIRNALARGIAL
jgi:hypothetical protein